MRIQREYKKGKIKSLTNNFFYRRNRNKNALYLVIFCPESGSTFTKFGKSAYDQCGSTSLDSWPNINVRENKGGRGGKGRRGSFIEQSQNHVSEQCRNFSQYSLKHPGALSSFLSMDGNPTKFVDPERI